MSNKELAKKEEGQELAAFDFSGDIGVGMEGTDKESFAIPFLRIIQKTSPQVDEADPAYNPQAKAGMFINTVTGELFDGKVGVTLLPCAYQRRFIRWAPRGAESAGFKGELLPEVVAAMKEEGTAQEVEGKLMAGADKLSDTRSHFCIMEETGAQLLLALSSTQIKKSKQLMSILSSVKVKMGDKLVTPPTWMNRIKVTTVLESNDQGSWYGVKFEPAGFVTSQELYATGKAFHEAVSTGAARGNFSDAEDDSGKF